MGWDQGDGISALQSENFPASEEMLKSHPRSDFHKHPRCSCSPSDPYNMLRHLGVLP